jgi:glycine C-acetyltransferase
MDIFSKLSMEKGPLSKHAQFHGYFTFPKLEGEIGARMKFKGKEVLVWSLNNYLGLANHPEVRKADAEAAAAYGMAYPMGARMMTGNSDYHEQLERELATFVHKPDSILLNYGYQGIFSIIDTLLSHKDVVVYDSECHACIIDGLRMHLGKRFVYPHNDVEKLEKHLQTAVKLASEKGGGVLVITEGVFGMSGAQGKLKEIVALKEKYPFRLLVDDAHGFGTMGETGAGTGEAQGCQDGIDLYFSTFAKSMAGIGAFVAGEKKVLDVLRYSLRSQIFAKSLPMAMVIGALKRLELLRTQPELRNKLWNIVNNLQDGLKARGFDIGKTTSPVTPVTVFGGEMQAAKIIYDLRENYGVFCSGVVYPVVPKGVIILRLIPTAAHSLDDVAYTINAFETVANKLKDGFYDGEMDMRNALALQSA